MAYTPQTWVDAPATTTPLSAARLTVIENGIQAAAATADAAQPLNANLTQISSLVDPNADRLMFWDDSAGTWTHLVLGTNLSITGTTLNATGSGGGDASTNTTTSVDSEVVLFSGTLGKTLKRATGTGLFKLVSGVLTLAVAGVDYALPARLAGTTSSATPSIDLALTDIYKLSAQAANITSVTLTNTGSATAEQQLRVIIIPTATRTIAWGSQFTGPLLPTSAPGTARLTVDFAWTGTQMYCIGSV